MTDGGGFRNRRGAAGAFPMLPAVLAYAVVLAALYREALGYLFRQWQAEDFSYCFLLPFVLAYLVYLKRDELRRAPSSPSRAGLWFVGAGVVLFWLGELGGEFYTLDLSLWLTVLGLFSLHLGGPKFRQLAFPAGLSLALFPPPNFVYANVSLRLKLLSSALGVSLIQLFGGSAYREGNVIDLGSAKLQVVDACSGLRYVFPLLVMGLLIGYFRHRSWWRRALLAVSTLPVSILVNGGRVALTGFLSTIWGTEIAEGFLHDFSGWLIFVLSCALLYAFSALMSRIAPEKTGRVPEGREDRPAADEAPPDAGRPGSVLRLSSPALGLLLVSLAVAQLIDFREKTPLRRPLSELPVALGDWSGTPQLMEQEFRNALAFSDYALVDFRSPEGKLVNLYVAYYDSQRKGESIHSPETCLPGSGWVFKEAGPSVMPTPGYGNGSVKVRRAFVQNGAQRDLVFFWFPQRGRILTTLPQMKLYTFWDALTKRRTDGALVRLTTPVYEPESVEGAEQRLRSFTCLLLPVLDRFVPGG